MQVFTETTGLRDDWLHRGRALAGMDLYPCNITINRIPRPLLLARRLRVLCSSECVCVCACARTCVLPATDVPPRLVAQRLIAGQCTPRLEWRARCGYGGEVVLCWWSCMW